MVTNNPFMLDQDYTPAQRKAQSLAEAREAKSLHLGRDTLTAQYNTRMGALSALQGKLNNFEKERKKQEQYSVPDYYLESSNPVIKSLAVARQTLSSAMASTKHIGAQAEALPNTLSAGEENQMPSNVVDAFNRHLNHKATKEDVALLNSRAYNTVKDWRTQSETRIPIGDETFLQRMNKSKVARLAAEKVIGNPEKGIPDKYDSQKYLNPVLQEARSREISQWRNSSGLNNFRSRMKVLGDNGHENAAMFGNLAADAIDTMGVIGTAAKHPSALIQDLGSLAPYLVGGAYTAAGGAALQAVTDHTNSRQQHREATGQFIPSEGDRTKMAGMMGVNFGLNYAENAFALKALKGGNVGAGAAINTTTPSVLKQLGASVGRPLGGTIADISKAVAVNTAAGYGQGAIQTGLGALQDYDHEKAVESGALGGALVGGLTTLTSAPVNTARAVGNTFKVLSAKNVERTAHERADFKENINPSSKHFNPTEAIQKQIISLGQEGADIDVVSGRAQEAVNIARAEHKPIADTFRVMQEELIQTEANKAEIAELKQKMVDDPTVDASKFIQMLQDDVNATEAKYTKEKQKEVTEAFKASKTTTDKAEEIYTAFTGARDQVQNTTTSTADAVQKVDAATAPNADTATKAAATKHARSFPMLYKPEKLLELASDLTNDLSDSQRNTLREFAESRVAEHAEKGIEGVSNDLLQGGKSYKSVPSYFTDFADAVKTGDENRQTDLVGGLGKLNESFVKKTELAERLHKIVTNPNAKAKAFQVTRTKTGEWKINRGKLLNDRDLHINGGFNIKPNSTSLVEGIKRDADYVAKQYDLLNKISSEEFRADPIEPHVDAEPLSDIDFGEAPDAEWGGLGANGSSKPAELPMSEPKVITDVDGSNYKEHQANADKKATETRAKDFEELKAKHVAEKSKVIETVKHENVEEHQQTKDDTSESREESEPPSSMKTEEDIDPHANEVEAIETKAPEKPKGEGAVPSVKAATPTTRKAEAAKPYHERNLVTQHFTQSGDNAPLVHEVNLMDSLQGEEGIAKAEEALGRSMTSEEKRHFEEFVGFHSQFSKAIEKAFIAKEGKNTQYRHQDLVQFLTGEDGKLDPNVVTAMASSAFQWMIENGTKGSLTDYEILKLLGIPTDVHHDIPNVVRDRYNRPFYQASVVAQGIGARAAKSLGLKALSTSDPNYNGRMEASLGGLTIMSLRGMGVLGHEVISGKDFNAARLAVDSESTPHDTKLSAVYVYPQHVFEGAQVVEVNGYIDEAVRSAKGARGVLGGILGTEEALVAPLLAPPEAFDQQSIKNSTTEIPDKLREDATKVQQTPHRIRPEITNVISTLAQHSESMLKRILGIDDSKENLSKYHQSTRANMEAKFKNEWTTLTRGLDFVNSVPRDEKGEYSSIYFPVTFWSNQRMGIASNMFNIQTSLIHRAMAGIASHEVEVTRGEMYDEKGKSTQYGTFLRAVAAGAEGSADFLKGRMKGKTVDKASPKEFLDAFSDYLQTPLVREGIEAMVRVLEATNEGEVPQESDVAAVAATVEQFDMGAMSLLSLTELARMEMTPEGQPFKTTIGIESDGVTNGPAIANMLSGTLTAALALQFGLIPKIMANNIKNYYDIKSQDKADYYQTFGKMQLDAITRMVNAGDVDSRTAEILGKLAGGFGTRGSAKKWATPFNYSAGYPALKAALARELKANVYKSFEKIAKAGKSENEATREQAQKDAEQILNDINAIIEKYNETAKVKVAKVPVSTDKVKVSIDAAKFTEKDLSPAQWNALSQVSKDVHGKASETAIKIAAKDYIATRDLNISMNNLAFNMYNNLRNQLIEKHTAEAVKSGEIATDAKGNKLEGLSTERLKAIDKILKPYRPIVVSAMGNIAGNSVDSGLLMGKKAKGSTKEDGNLVKVFSAVDGKTSSMELGVATRELQAPGVAGSAMWVQAADSFISQYTVARHDATNVHDANIGSVANSADMAKTQNAGFFEVMVGYRSQVENLNALVRALNGYAITKDKHGIQVTEEMLTELHNGLVTALVKGDIYDKDTAETLNTSQLLRALADAKYRAEVNKITFAEGLHAIHQYSGEGGELVLDDMHRNRLMTEKANLEKDRVTAIKHMHELVNNIRRSVNGKEVTQAPPDGSHLQSVLAKYLGEEIPHAEMLSALEQQLTSDGRPEHLELFKVLQGIIPKDLKFEYVTDSWVGQKGASGWYNSTANKISIRAVGTKFSHVKAELVLHELIHASLVSITTNPDAHPDVKASIERIDSLRQELIEQGLDKQFPEALANAEEFMAWGLTNPELQDVLRVTVTTKGDRRKGNIGTAFARFVKNVVSIIFQGKKQPNGKTISAIEALLLDSAEIIQYVSTQDPDRSHNPDQTFPMIKNLDDALNQIKNANASSLVQTMDAGSTSSKFQDHLQTVVDTSITRMLDAVGKDHLQDLTKPIGYTPKGLATTHGLSAREEYVTELMSMVVESSLDDAANTSVARELNRMYTLAREKLSPESFYEGDWSKASASDKNTATMQYNQIFRPTATGGRSSYLSNFAALAVGSERFNALLDFSVKAEKAKDRGFFEKLHALVNSLVDWASSAVAGTRSGMNANERVRVLADNLVTMDIAHRQGILAKADNLWEKGVNLVQSTSGKGASKIAKLITATKADQANNKVVRTTAKLAKALTNQHIDEVPELIKMMRDQSNPSKRFGELAEIANEVMEPNDFKKLMEAYLRESVNIQQHRKSWIEIVKRGAIEGFANKGADLTREDHTAITGAFLRTDVQSLMDNYKFKDVLSFVTDHKIRKREMQKLQQEILKMDSNGNDMIIRAHDLGRYMAGDGAGIGLAKNALTIADGVGTHYRRPETDHSDAGLIKAIDDLASMYALEYQSKATLDRVASVLKREAERKDGVNGVENLVKLHKYAVDDSKKLFNDNPYSMAKGYLPEITHTYRQPLVAPKMDAASLAKEGWDLVADVPRDPMDTQSGDQALYVLKDGGIQRIVSGAATYDSTHAKGKTITDGMDGAKTAQYSKMVDARVRARSNIPFDKYSPEKYSMGNRMIPVYDTNGNTIDFRYEMTGYARDTVLSRNHNFGDLLGSYIGNSATQQSTKDQNTKVFDALHQDYKDNYSKNPRGYVAIGPNSTDPHLAEIWRMLPYDVKMHVESMWGAGKPMMVRNELVNVTFGFKKYSIGEMFDKEKGERNVAEKCFVGLIEGLTGMAFKPKERAKLYAVRGERFIQEIIKKVKDFVIIRTASVLWGNIKANALLHMAYGVSPIALVRDSWKAVRAGLTYKKQRALMIQAEMNLRAGVGDRVKWERQLVKAQDDLARNPLQEFIDAGMLPSIVEDMELNSTDYTYQTEFSDKFDKQLDRVPKSVRTVGKWAMVSPDTPLYKFLAGSTQFSDFTAKYVLYKHLMTRGESRMDHASAIQEASDAFINYDVPTSRGLQYMNDVGLFMFTKFFLRFQRVMLKLMRTRAAMTLSQHYATEWLSNTPGILDPLATHHIGNPFRSSIFQAPSAMTDTATMNALF